MNSTTQRTIFGRLYHGETKIDFIGRTKLWFAISGVVILLGLLSLVIQGLNLGIDFEGGTVWELPQGDASVEDVRDALEPVGLEDARIQVLGGDRVRVQAGALDDAAERQERVEEVRAALADVTGARENQVNVDEVGPSWGNEITRKAQRALVFFLVAITIYITLRFEWKMAIATLAALFHDILVTVGVYSLSGFEVTPATVIALLTILGYSIYDGIVVFDKVEENTRGLAATGRMGYGEVVNLSLNEVLMRSLNTSITALLPILSLLILGGYVLGAVTLADFALALLVGLAASAYSSIFIASPLLAILKEREPRYKAIRQRLESRGTAGGLLTPAAVAASGARSGGADGGAGGDSDGREQPEREMPRPEPGTAASRYGNAPRPRKRRRK